VRRKGGLAVGIDLSAAVDAGPAEFPRRPGRADRPRRSAQPAVPAGAFDAGFSIGVLHHTPAPAEGLAALARCVRAGGRVACCVYPKNDFYDFPSVARLRRLHLALKPLVGYRFALAYSYIAAFVLAPLLRQAKQHGLRQFATWFERNVLVSLWLKDVRWRLLDTFDAITPAIASTHTTDEVRDWFDRAAVRAPGSPRGARPRS
jgi:SAM-dependent methyltransferase